MIVGESRILVHHQLLLPFLIIIGIINFVELPLQFGLRCLWLVTVISISFGLFFIMVIKLYVIYSYYVFGLVLFLLEILYMAVLYLWDRPLLCWGMLSVIMGILMQLAGVMGIWREGVSVLAVICSLILIPILHRWLINP